LTCHFAAPKGCFSGFRSLTTHKGESATWYSYREDHAYGAVCRQSEIGNRVTWETTLLPKDCSAERVTFVFAGGLGYSSQPKTAGFALDIGGKEALRFDLAPPGKWVGAANGVELRFEKRRTVTEDQFGLFYLTIPRSMLEVGKPCQLGVRSLGSGSQRWFGLNHYSDAR
jgi:protease II